MNNNAIIKTIHKDERTFEEKIQVVKEKYKRLPYTEQNTENMNNEIKVLQIDEATKKYSRGEISQKEWEKTRIGGQPKPTDKPDSQLTDTDGTDCIKQMTSDKPDTSDDIKDRAEDYAKLDCPIEYRPDLDIRLMKGRNIKYNGTKHGLYNTTIYKVWSAMKSRCSNPNDAGYKRYGARGIIVCEHWKKFINFLSDMGIPPKGYTLDRIDSNKGYYKENCRWTTRSHNNANKKRVKGLNVLRGTEKTKKGYIARISINNKQTRLGCYKTMQEAYQVYCNKYQELYGELPPEDRQYLNDQTKEVLWY